ncbi:MAG: hypothetical protein GY909_15830 [Oligoflexia bacterium]|nr:hypothetical protein [Oligoflexia bacterium]
MIFYIGSDQRYFDRLNRCFGLDDVAYVDIEKESIGQILRMVAQKAPKIIYIDFTSSEDSSLILESIRHNYLEEAVYVGLYKREMDFEIDSISSHALTHLNYVKGLEINDVSRHPIELVKIQSKKIDKFASARLEESANAQVSIYIHELDERGLTFETDLELKVGKVYELDIPDLTRRLSSKKVKITKRFPYSLFKNEKNRFRATWILVDLPKDIDSLPDRKREKAISEHRESVEYARNKLSGLLSEKLGYNDKKELLVLDFGKKRPRDEFIGLYAHVHKSVCEELNSEILKYSPDVISFEVANHDGEEGKFQIDDIYLSIKYIKEKLTKSPMVLLFGVKELTNEQIRKLFDYEKILIDCEEKDYSKINLVVSSMYKSIKARENKKHYQKIGKNVFGSDNLKILERKRSVEKFFTIPEGFASKGMLHIDLLVTMLSEDSVFFCSEESIKNFSTLKTQLINKDEKVSLKVTVAPYQEEIPHLYSKSLKSHFSFIQMSSEHEKASLRRFVYSRKTLDEAKNTSIES